MLTLLRDLFMSVETSADKAVFMLCEWTAGALIFGFIEGISTNKPIGTLSAYAALAILFAIAGVVWPRVKATLRVRYSKFVSRVEQIAGDYRYRTGAVFLLLGYFTASAGMYMHSLRSDIDMYITPRSITQTQSEKLRDYLSKYEANAVSVRVVQHDPEAMEYAAQLFNAMRQTNWDINPPNHSGPEYQHLETTQKEPKVRDLDANGKRLYKSTDEYVEAHDAWFETKISNKIAEQNYDATGLCVEVEMTGQPVNPDPRHPAPESILQDGLRYAGIEVNCSGGAYSRSKYAMYLLIGHRPHIIGNQEPVLRKIGRWIERLGQ
jgi:hypothetical protein